MNRSDVETLMFGAALGGAVTFAELRSSFGIFYALTSGAAAACGAVAVLYGLVVITRSLPGVAAGIVEFGMVVRSPVGLAAQGVPARAALAVVESQEGTDEPADREQRWRVALRQFLLAGRLAGGLSIRTLTASGMMTDTAYRALAGALRDNAILLPSKAGTDYAPGFNYGRAVWMIKHERLALPEGEPARIKF